MGFGGGGGMGFGGGMGMELRPKPLAFCTRFEGRKGEEKEEKKGTLQKHVKPCFSAFSKKAHWLVSSRL